MNYETDEYLDSLIEAEEEFCFDVRAIRDFIKDNKQAGKKKIKKNKVKIEDKE